METSTDTSLIGEIVIWIWFLATSAHLRIQHPGFSISIEYMLKSNMAININIFMIANFNQIDRWK